MWVVHESRLFKFMKVIRLMPKRFVALTLFEWILTDRKELPVYTLWHEQQHVRQYRWHLYVFYLPMYLLLWAIFGYKNHPYEVAARLHADRMIKRG